MKRLVCESLQQFYKLNEDIEIAKQIFTNNDISSEDSLYKEFFELLSDVPEEDIDIYAKWVVNAGIDPDYIENELKKLKDNDLILDKPASEFNNFRNFRNYVKEKIKEKEKIKNKEDNEEILKNSNINILSEPITFKGREEKEFTKNQDTNIITDITKTTERPKIPISVLGSIVGSTDGEEIELKEIKTLPYKLQEIPGYKGKYVYIKPTQYDEELHEAIFNPGQGLYIWANLAYLQLNANIFKVGQYGAKTRVDAKTPQKTIKSYSATTTDTIVILYAIRLDEWLKSSENKNVDGSLRFKDAERVEKAIHKKILSRENGGISVERGTSKETFGNIMLDRIIEIINGILHNVEKPLAYKMRPEQEKAHDQICDTFRSGKKEFLLAAKMRFGKNFTFLNVAKTLNMKNVLVLTYKPHVFRSLEKDVKSHTLFKDWKFTEFKDNRKINESNEPCQIIVSSAQLAQYKYKTESEAIESSSDFIRKNIAALSEITLDMIIVDEYHYGESTVNFRDEIIGKLNFNHILYVSGTAFRDIQEGRFDDDQIYSWDYIDEQKEKQRGSIHHQMMPTMITHLMHISPQAKEMLQNYTENEGLNMTKLISVKKDKHNKTILKNGQPQLMDEGSLERLLDQIAGTKDRVEYSPLRMKNMKHTFWVLDKNTDGIIAMANLMKRMDFYKKGYYIIPATGNEVTDINEVVQTINKAKSENKGTITLSCVRFKEGVTVPEWNGVLMLDGGNSLEEYLQAIFRCQSSNEGKNECHVFDFNPQRCLKMVYKAAENRDKGLSAEISQVLTEYLKYAPILDNLDNELYIDDTVNRIIDTFRADMSAKTKFSNVKNINEYKIDDEVKRSLANVTITPQAKKELQVSDSDLSFGKTKTRTPLNDVPDNDDEERTENDKKNVNYISKIKYVLSNIPEYLFNSPSREESIEQILNGDDNLFFNITGIRLKVFEMWINKGVINKNLLRRDIVDFAAAERIFIESRPSLKDKDKFFNQHFNMRAAEGITNSELVNQMLEKLPQTIWKDPLKRFCDITAGTGTFLQAIKEKLLLNLPESLPGKYSNIHEKETYILNNMLWGYDNNKSKILICKKLLGKTSNIKYTDNILNENLNNMKFDVITGNPPYHLGANKFLYMDFLKKSYENTKNDGIILYVTPAAVYTNKQKFYLDNKHKFSYINIDPTIGEKYFTGIGLGTLFTYYVIKKDKNDPYVIIDRGDTQMKVNIDTLEYPILDYRNIDKKLADIMKNIYQYGVKIFYRGAGSVTTNPDNPQIFKHEKNNEYKYPAYLSSDEKRRTVYSKTPGKGYGIIKLTVSHILVPGNAAQFSEISTNKGVGRYSVYYPCKNIKEAKNIQDFFNSEIYKYIDKKRRGGRYACMDIPNLDFSKNWSNDELYKYLNLTKYKKDIKSEIKM